MDGHLLLPRKYRPGTSVSPDARAYQDQRNDTQRAVIRGQGDRLCVDVDSVVQLLNRSNLPGHREGTTAAANNVGDLEQTCLASSF